MPIGNLAVRKRAGDFEGVDFGGWPPFAPLLRAAFCLAGLVDLPPRLPSATTALFFFSAFIVD
jgi:hypothetical protein